MCMDVSLNNVFRKNTFSNDDASIYDNAYNINDNNENSLAAKYYIYKLNKLFTIFHQNEEPQIK